MHTGKLKKLYMSVTKPKPPRQREPVPSNTPAMTAVAPVVSAFDHEKIELPSGLVLEASLSVPTAGVSHTGAKLAVCLHPWSWLGGRMNDPYVCELSYNVKATLTSVVFVSISW